MGQREIEAVKRAHRTYLRDSYAVDSEVYAEDAVWVSARDDPDPETLRGIDEIQGYFLKWTEMFEDIEFEATELIDAGDKVFAWIRFAGRGAASGVPVELQQAQVISFRDGRIVRVEEYFNREEGLRAAGLTAGGR